MFTGLQMASVLSALAGEHFLNKWFLVLFYKQEKIHDMDALRCLLREFFFLQVNKSITHTNRTCVNKTQPEQFFQLRKQNG